MLLSWQYLKSSINVGSEGSYPSGGYTFLPIKPFSWYIFLNSLNPPTSRIVLGSAAKNGKRYYNVPTVKSSDLSLAYYVAKKKKFFPDDHSLIVYIGKEYSKLIFLQGRRLKHLGTTLDIGVSNLHTYDVYFSKILIEMENGGIPALENIIVCGEEGSENIILSF